MKNQLEEGDDQLTTSLSIVDIVLVGYIYLTGFVSVFPQS